MKGLKPPVMKAPMLPGAAAPKLGRIGAMPGGGRHGSVKPRLRARHLSIAGKSAFPNANAAFATPDAEAGPAAAFAGGSLGAGPGEMGE